MRPPRNGDKIMEMSYTEPAIYEDVVLLKSYLSWMNLLQLYKQHTN